MSSLEITATVFAFIYIVLAIVELQISWLISILSSILYIFLFWKASLYLQSILQIFFIISSFYGWWAWDKKRANEIKIGYLTKFQNFIWICASILISVPTAALLSHFSDSPTPILDSTTTIFSISATLLSAHKKIESWWYWIGINLLSIWMFAEQELYLTSFIYAGFLLLAWIGDRTWRRNAKIE